MPNANDLARIEAESQKRNSARDGLMPFADQGEADYSPPSFTHGQLVEYVGSILPHMKGKQGNVVTALDRKGYVRVDFEGSVGSYVPWSLKPAIAEEAKADAMARAGEEYDPGQLTEGPQPVPIKPPVTLTRAQLEKIDEALTAALFDEHTRDGTQEALDIIRDLY